VIGRAIECRTCALGAVCPGHCIFVRSSHASGQVIFRQGERPQAAHFLSRGLVLLTESNEEGEVVRQSLRPAGSLLDVQVVKALPYRATATAVTPVQICTLGLTRLDAWLGPRGSPTRALLDLALIEARSAERDAVRTRQSAVGKVASFLLDHIRDAGEPHSEPLELQHQLVASLLGMRPETFSRALVRLRKSGAIVGTRSVRVRDRRKLVALARETASAEELSELG
jgi:CRP-like cAMP-binding protein